MFAARPRSITDGVVALIKDPLRHRILAGRVIPSEERRESFLAAQSLFRKKSPALPSMGKAFAAVQLTLGYSLRRSALRPDATHSCSAWVPAQAFHGLGVRCLIAAHPASLERPAHTILGEGVHRGAVHPCLRRPRNELPDPPPDPWCRINVCCAPARRRRCVLVF